MCNATRINHVQKRAVCKQDIKQRDSSENQKPKPLWTGKLCANAPQPERSHQVVSFGVGVKELTGDPCPKATLCQSPSRSVINDPGS